MNKSTLLHRIHRQRGVALIVALLVVALATVLIAALLDRGELSAARTRNALRSAQAEAYAQGLEAYAARVLQQDQNSNSGIDAADDMWAMPLPSTPVPGGEISATMRDLDGRFNLNNLDPAQDPQQVWQHKFELLLTALKLDPRLAQTVRDWMSNSAATQSGDGYYLAQPLPYRSAKREFQHVSELRLLRGVSGEVYARLAPYVSALPGGTKINVNTASVPVLMTLVSGAAAGSPVTQQSAEALWQQGHARFTSLSDMAKMVPGILPDCGTPAQAQACYATQSEYFLARGEITLDGLAFVFHSLIRRAPSGPDGGIRVIQRSRGADG